MLWIPNRDAADVAGGRRRRSSSGSSLWLSGAWRPEPSWIDRAGRALGIYWILISVFFGWAFFYGLIVSQPVAGHVSRVAIIQPANGEATSSDHGIPA